MEGVIYTILTGVLSGLISSLVYFCLMRAIKPKIKVAPSIIVQKNASSYTYFIKVVNLTKYDLIDIYYSFQIYKIASDKNVDTSYLTNIKPVLRHIEKYSKTENDTYAVRLSFIDNEKRDLDENSYLVFTIYATHGVSGRSIVSQTKYYKNQLVENALYETGKSVRFLNFDSYNKENS